MSEDIPPSAVGSRDDNTKPLLDSASASTNHYSSIDYTQQDMNERNERKEKNENVISPMLNHRPSYTYEELSNGLTCPTCRGTGKIPRGQEDDLVALIPYGDDRLKPRRTCLYVTLSFVLCIVLAGVLCALLIPRSIDVAQDNVKTLHVDLNVTQDRCFMTLQSVYNVTNNNFVAVNANDLQLEVTVMFYKQMVLNKKFVRNQRLGLRSTQQILENFNVTLNKSQFPIDYCMPTPLRDNYIFMKFQSTFNFTLLAQTDQQIVTEYFRVNCNPEDARDPIQLSSVKLVDYDKAQRSNTIKNELQ